MHLPAATIRTQVMLPLRFADGFGTTARVYTFDGLADGREHLILGLGERTAAVSADPKVPPVVGIQRVLHGRRARQRAVRLRAAAARGGPRRTRSQAADLRQRAAGSV
jgi:hypothetical protein